MDSLKIKLLEETHKNLDQQIIKIVNSGGFDDHKVSILKKKKLQLKDEISRLRRLDWEEKHERIYLDDER